MTRLVAVHGIGQQFKGPETLKQSWFPPMLDGIMLAMQDGLTPAGLSVPCEGDLTCPFYGDLFRTSGSKSPNLPAYSAIDLDTGFEQDLIALWWRSAAASETVVPNSADRTKIRTPKTAQRALNALSHSKFFAGVTERGMVWFAKQVHKYFEDEAVRRKAIDRVAQSIGSDTRVLVGHSLGSVIAYEALSAYSPQSTMTFVSLGSPLATPNLIFERLRPKPVGGRGAWPPGVRQWINLADSGDVVALIKALRPHFGEGAQIIDKIVYNGSRAHDVQPYLTAKETGCAIAAGLAA